MKSNFLALSVLLLLSLDLQAEVLLRMQHLQTLGTHNSFHQEMPAPIISAIKSYSQELGESLEYAHEDLHTQLTELKARHIELDVFHDPKGGHYRSRKALQVLGEDPYPNIPQLLQPGLKVLHLQDVDYLSHCLTFKECLNQIKTWSSQHPQHIPLMIAIEARDEVIDDPMEMGFTRPLPLDLDFLETIESEILEVFSQSKILTPDDVRGDFLTLEAAILDHGWPSIDESRGKVFFVLNTQDKGRDLYLQGHPSLRGRLMFATSSAGREEAAVMFFGDPTEGDNFAQIQDLVKKGYLVRTRADSSTIEARANDYRRQDLAFRSGAQYVVSDYLKADPRRSSYVTRLPILDPARCNPLYYMYCGEYPIEGF